MTLTAGSMNIPKKFRLPLTIVVAVLILAGGYYFFLMPQFEEKHRQEAEKSKVDQELARLTSIEKNIGKARTEYAGLKQQLEDAMRQMPEEKEIPALLRQVSLAASETKTRVGYFAPKGLQPVEFYSELPFEMKYSAPYHNIGYFFDGIRKLERIVRIVSFSLEAKGSGQKMVLEGNCTAKAYVLSNQPAGGVNSTKKDSKNEPIRK